MDKYVKNKAIRQLFEDNYHGLIAADITTPVKKNGICYDGIVDEAEFEKCKLTYGANMVFLLKETNGNMSIRQSDGTIVTMLPDVLPDWDYRRWLQEQQAGGKHSDDPMYSNAFYGAAYNKLCMWTELFYDTLADEVLPFNEYKKTRYNEANFRNILKRTGVVNLKKTWGDQQTDWKDLYSYLWRNMDSIPQQVLRAEMEIISPDVVICGSRQTFDIVQNIFDGPVCRVMLPDGTPFDYMEKNRIIYIDFYHPSCRGSIEKLYNYAQVRFAMLKTLLQKEK